MLIRFGLHPIDPATGSPGHSGAPGVAITSLSDRQRDDGSYETGYVVGTNGQSLRDHLFDYPGQVQHLPGQEAFLEVWHSLRPHLAEGDRPLWVAVEPQERDEAYADDFERCLSEVYRCSRGVPIDLEDTHFTLHGNTVWPPGQKPEEG